LRPSGANMSYSKDIFQKIKLIVQSLDKAPKYFKLGSSGEHNMKRPLLDISTILGAKLAKEMIWTIERNFHFYCN